MWYAGICEEANVSNKFLFLVGHNLVTSSVFPLDQFLLLVGTKNNLGGMMIQRIFVEKMSQSARLFLKF